MDALGALALGLVLLAMLAARARSCRPTGEAVTFDGAALRILAGAAADGRLRLIATTPARRDPAPAPARPASPEPAAAIFIEVLVDPERRGPIEVRGDHHRGYSIMTVRGRAAGPAIAAALLKIRDITGIVPRVDFAWPERGQTGQLLRFLLLGTGHVAAVTLEVLRRAEPDRDRRPRIHVGP
ncbi:hypothetical protein [Catellatospora paridis]|uniref:hypothetical protein n=1 Tax=Catellatospora paridis TaxID=1617086 RepID=UPI0012D3CFF9|nr:hypothetical protein [Catellatospora paridis]